MGTNLTQYPRNIYRPKLHDILRGSLLARGSTVLENQRGSDSSSLDHCEDSISAV